MALKRQSPMNRGKPPKQRKPLERGKPLKRTGELKRSRLAPVSGRRRAERDQRDAVRAATAIEHGWVCVYAARRECRNEWGDPWQPGQHLDIHETIRRSQLTGAHLNALVCVTVCRFHHDVDVSLPAAEAIGLRAPGWTVTRYGIDAVLDEMHRIRAEYNASGTPGTPFWRVTLPSNTDD